MKLSSVAVSLALLLLLVSPAIAFAQTIPTIVPCCGAQACVVNGVSLPACSFCHIAQLAQNVINAGIYVAVFLSAILFAYAGWKYITASGKPEAASEAKKIFWTVGVGLLLILGAWLIVDLIMKTLVNESALFGPWNEVC